MVLHWGFLGLCSGGAEMRILAIGRLPECEVGGLPLYTANLMQAMGALGHKCCIVHPGASVRSEHFATRSPREITWPQTGRLRSFRQAFAVSREARLAALDFRPDVIHLQYGGAMDLAILRCLTRPGALVESVPIVVTAHCGRAWSHLARAPRLAMQQLAKAACVLVISEDQKALFEYSGLPASHIVEIGSLIESEFFFRPPERKAIGKVKAIGFERAVYLGRIAPEKGLETVIDALAQLDLPERPNFTATGPVSDAYRARLMSLCSQADVKASFNLAAPVSGVGARMAVLDEADFLLHPTHSDVKPLVVIEAMARRLPILASALPGTVQLCRGTAMHFEPGNANALAACLRARAVQRKKGTLDVANTVGFELAHAFKPEAAAHETLGIFERLISAGVPA